MIGSLWESPESRNRFLVYALIDPRTGEYRYVGKSSSGLQRPKGHLRNAKKGESNWKSRWILKLDAEGLRYEIAILEETTKESLNERETWWISWYRPFGRLTNITAGAHEESDQREAGRIGAAKWLASSSHEERSAIATERHARIGSERWSEICLRREANRDPEQKKSMMAKLRASWTTDGFRSMARAREANKTPEQRRENTLKGHRTRWAKRAARELFEQNSTTPPLSAPKCANGVNPASASSASSRAFPRPGEWSPYTATGE